MRNIKQRGIIKLIIIIIIAIALLSYFRVDVRGWLASHSLNLNDLWQQIWTAITGIWAILVNLFNGLTK